MLNILLTRPLAQVKVLESLVLEKGYQPLLFPTLKVESICTTVKRKQYDAVIFISANAVEHGLEILNSIQYGYIFTVGAATAKKLNRYNISVDDFPKEKASSEALLGLDSVAKLTSKNILIFRGKGGRETLKIGLEKNNNLIEYVEVYDRVVCAPTELHQQSLMRFIANDRGVISITSNENLDGLITLAKQLDTLDAIKSYPLIVLSARIKKYAQILGFNQITITPDISDQSIISVLEMSDTLDN